MSYTRGGNMLVDVSSPHVQHSEALDNFVKDRAEKILKSFDDNRNETYLRATLTKERQNYIWNLSYQYRRFHIHVAKGATEAYSAALMALKCLRGQLEKQKKKIQRKHKGEIALSP